MPFTEIKINKKPRYPQEMSSRENKSLSSGESSTSIKKGWRGALKFSFVAFIFSAEEALNLGGSPIKPKVRKKGIKMKKRIKLHTSRMHV